MYVRINRKKIPEMTSSMKKTS